MEIIQSIQTRIYELRNERVMLDFDLAELYEVETRVLNQAVKRNIDRFPADFMFQLTFEEYELIKERWNSGVQDMSSQFVMTYPNKYPFTAPQQNPSSQFVMMELPQNRTGKYLPYAFTEQGVAILSGVLRSPKAITMNIAIMRAFVELRRALLQNNDVTKQLSELRLRLGEHDMQLNQIYEAIENLLDDNAYHLKWYERNRIGFKH